MKSILIIGVGRFGRHLAHKMQDLGTDVMIVDENEKLVDQLAADFTNALAGDCTNEEVMRTIGVSSFDVCFVTIGENFQSSLVITALLKKMGAKMVIAKANQDIQAEILKKIGADEVVFPEREMAEKLAVRFSSNKNIFDYIPLTSEFSIFEISIPMAWVGQSIAALEIRRKYKVNIVAVKMNNVLRPVPGPDYIFDENDHVVVIGKSTDVFKINAKQ